MLIFNKGQLWIVEWARKFNVSLKCQVITDVPAILKKDDIIYVSDHSVSHILHHVDNCRSSGYVPLNAIFEIYRDGAILRRSEGLLRNRPCMITQGLDPNGLTVIGLGSRAFIASLALTDGDVMAALRNTAKVTASIKRGARVTQYTLPQITVPLVEPDNDFILE